MKERLLITTAIGLMLGTAAFAQSPSEQPKNNPPPAAQNQTNSNSSAPAASSSTSSPSSTPSTQSQSTPSGTGSTTTSQSGNNAAPAPSQAQSAQPSNSPAQAQSNTAPPANTNQTQSSPTGANNAGTQPSTNTAAQPSNNQTNTAAQPSNNQTNTAAQPSTNQTNTAAQPSTNQTNTAQSSSSNVRVSTSLNETQRIRVSESIARLNVAPLNNVNFSLSVGTVVPRDVRFQPLPADVVEVMPQYRGYNFFVVRDEIVIVDPTTYKIVDVLPRTGRSTAAAPAPHRTTFSDRDREVIRKHARSSRTEQRTTGSATSTRVKVGERLPDSVEIRSFPDEVYRESPSLREYRYIERDNRTYLIEPRERTIIEEID